MPESNSSEDDVISFYSDPKGSPDFQLPIINFPSTPTQNNLLHNGPIPKYSQELGIDNFILQVHGFFSRNKECFNRVRAAQYLLAYSFQRDLSFLLHRHTPRLTRYESLLQWLYERTHSVIQNLSNEIPHQTEPPVDLRLPRIQFPETPASLNEISNIAPFPKLSHEYGTESFVQQCYFFFTQNRECFTTFSAARFLIMNSFEGEMNYHISNQGPFTSIESILQWVYRQTYSTKTRAEMKFKLIQPKSNRISDLLVYINTIEKLHFDTRISDVEAIRMVISKIPKQYDMWVIPLYHYNKFSLFTKHLSENLQFAFERERERPLIRNENIGSTLPGTGVLYRQPTKTRFRDW